MLTDSETLAENFPPVQPFDEHNQRLLANAHPPDWVNPPPAGRYNLVVIGGGTAGLVTAAGAAGMGAKVALIERALLGGDCLNVGCVPSKALIRAARAVAEVRAAGELGICVPSGVRVDFGSVMRRTRAVRADISPHDSAARFRDLGVDVFLGEAAFRGPDSIEVAGQTLRFARACIATGARPAIPSIEGLDAAGYLTNETLFSLTALPQRLGILGGGPIGCEMAQAFARLGAQVFLIERGPRVLSREDPEAGDLIGQALIRDGVELLTRATLNRVETHGRERRLFVEVGGESRELVVDQILVGAGRAPNVEGLNLEAAGVRYEPRKGIEVNDFLQTTNSRIYAAGDVCFPHKFTHTADALARIVIQNALFFGRARASELVIPWCTYTSPEVAHVGISAADVERQKDAVQTIRIELASVDRARLDGQTEGFLKVYLKRGTDRILGGTLVAEHAGEMISELTLAMVAGVGLRTLAKTIHPYPTQAEVLKKAADAYNRTRLTPRLQKLFKRLLQWRR